MLVPKLRFKEFNDEWKTFKIQDTFVFLSTNSLSRDSLNYNNGTIQNIHYGDIHTILPTICNVNKERLPYINYDAIYKNTNFVQENDLLIADASENYDDIGKSIEVIELDNKKIVGGLHTLLLRCELNLFAPKFKGYLFNTNNIRTQIKILSVGAKVLGISKDNLKKITFYLPNLEEQTKIANFLSLIDRKIELQEKLVENLKLYKKGLLKKVFSNNQGWKMIKIKDIFQISRGIIIPKKELSSVKDDKYKYPVYSSQTSNNGILGYSKTFDFNGQYLTWTTDGANAGTVFFRTGKFRCTNVCGLLYDEKNLFNNIAIKEILQLETPKHVSYVGNPKLMNNTMGDINIKIPSIEEQNRIANLFTSLDKKIELETKKLQDLKTYKKGLLQKMFI